MDEPALGPWVPFPLADTVTAFAGAGCRWWVSGGRALELAIGCSWRDHSDTDVGLLRRDVLRLRLALDGWDIWIAADGRLEQWTGAVPEAERSQNNLWCRRDPGAPWALDVTVGDGDDHDWIYRRDTRLRVPWADAVLASEDGIPYLAPELQLLFKSTDIRPKDDFDAQQVIPELAVDASERLSQLLPADHPWQRLLLDR
jgi:hypothetical protein